MEVSETLKKNLERCRQGLEKARASVDYWADGQITEFIEDVWRLMEEQKVSRAELARRLGTSRAYVTKLLGGNANFTLQTNDQGGDGPRLNLPRPRRRSEGHHPLDR